MGDNQKISQCAPGYVQTGNEVKCGRSGTETLCLDYPVCEKEEEARTKADAAGTLQQKSADLKKLLKGAPQPTESGKSPESGGGKMGGAPPARRFDG